MFFKKKKKKEEISVITHRSNIVQYDTMGYPLRLVIVDNKEQIWIDTYSQEGDIELKWQKTPFYSKYETEGRNE